MIGDEDQIGEARQFLRGNAGVGVLLLNKGRTIGDLGGEHGREGEIAAGADDQSLGS